MSEEQQAGPSAAMQQFQLNSQIAAASGGAGAGGDAPGNIIDAILRKFGLNGHSTGGLAALFGDLPGIFSGLSMQTGSIFGKLNMQGGVLASFFANLGFEFGGSIHGDVTAGVQNNDVDTSGSASSGGGDSPSAASIPIPPVDIPVMSASHAANIQAPVAPKGESAGAGMEM